MLIQVVNLLSVYLIEDTQLKNIIFKNFIIKSNLNKCTFYEANILNVVFFPWNILKNKQFSVKQHVLSSMWKHISTFGMQNATNYYYLQFEAIHVDKVGIMTTSKVLLKINFY